MFDNSIVINWDYGNKHLNTNVVRLRVLASPNAIWIWISSIHSVATMFMDAIVSKFPKLYTLWEENLPPQIVMECWWPWDDTDQSRPIMVSPATLRYRTGCLVVNQAKPQNINICFSVYTLVTTKGCRRVGLQNWTDSHIVVCTWEPWLTAVLGPYIITQSNAVVSILSS